MACSSTEEWEELVENLQGGRKQESKRLYSYLNNELLPYVLQEISTKVSSSSHDHSHDSYVHVVWLHAHYLSLGYVITISFTITPS